MKKDSALVAAMQVMRPRGQPLHLLAERAGPWLAAEAYVTALALSLLADTFAVALSCVAELRGLLPWPAYLVYGGSGLTDGLVVTPVGVAMAALVAVGIFKLVMRMMQTSGPRGPQPRLIIITNFDLFPLECIILNLKRFT